MARGLIRVLDDTVMVARVRASEDSHAMADLYHDIGACSHIFFSLLCALNAHVLTGHIHSTVRGYDHIPDLRITWLRALSDLHTEHGMHAEAGMCLLRAAM